MGLIIEIESKNAKPKKFWTVFFALVGLALFIFASTNLVGQLKTKNWAEVQGLILKSEALSMFQEYEANVEYEYVVEGEKYISNQISYGAGTTSSDLDGVNKFLGKFLVGTQVPVYYNPKKPEESVLVTTMESFYFYVLLFGVFFITMAFWYHKRNFGNREVEPKNQ